MYDCISSASFLILNCRFVELTVVTTYQQTDRPTRWSCAKTSFYQVSVALHASHGSMRPIATHMSPVSGATVCVGLGPRDTPVNPAKRLNQLRCRLGADTSAHWRQLVNTIDRSVRRQRCDLPQYLRYDTIRDAILTCARKPT